MRVGRGQLAQPEGGDGQPEQHRVGSAPTGVKASSEGIVSLMELLVDELAADLMLVGEGRDRLSAQHRGQVADVRGCQRLCGGRSVGGWAAVEDAGRDTNRAGSPYQTRKEGCCPRCDGFQPLTAAPTNRRITQLLPAIEPRHNFELFACKV